MTEQLYARLARGAAIGVGYTALLLFAVLSGVSVLGGSQLLLLVVAIPLLLAGGPYQAQIALNPRLGDRQRRRWRIALWFLPAAMTLYWYRYLRGILTPD